MKAVAGRWLDVYKRQLLTNNEVISVSQDPMVAPAKKMMVENGQVWSKKLYDGSYAVGFFHVDPYFILWDQEDAEACLLYTSIKTLAFRKISLPVWLILI